MEIKDAKATIKKLLAKSGAEVRFKGLVKGTNHRGVPVEYPGEQVVTAKVLLLEERFDILSGRDAIPAENLKTAKSILMLVETPLYRDALIYDGDDNVARLDTPDRFDIFGEPIFNQAPIDLIENAIGLDEQEPEADDDTEEDDEDVEDDTDTETETDEDDDTDEETDEGDDEDEESEDDETDEDESEDDDESDEEPEADDDKE